MTASGAAGAAAQSGQSAFLAGNQHSDVMSAAPADDAARERLVEELKRRGNAAFKARSMREAELLYSRAIEHDSKVVALFSNRAMTRLAMGEFEGALEDAEAAIKLEPENTKAWFRAGKAEVGLKRMGAAEKRFQKVAQLDPSNKAAAQELKLMPERKVKAEADAAAEAKRAKEEAERKAKEAAQVVSRRVVAVDKDDGSKKKKNDASPQKKTAAVADGEVDLSLRGYRTLADGRKTTFFNRELTEEEREMLKDNKPKALDKEADEIRAKEEDLAKKGGSAWNHGGTFEERPMTEWANAKLKEHLVGIKCPVTLVDAEGDADAETIEVTGLKAVEGDASITFTRGKQRQIFDFTVDVSWSVQCLGQTVSGTIFLHDVSGDEVSGDPSDGTVEAELRWSNRDKAGPNQAALAKALMDKSSGLLHHINKAVHAFAVEFRQVK